MSKWPNWLKTIWWVIITSGLSLLMIKRLDNFINGTNTVTDITILFILFALYLAPIFQDIELPGIKLKSQINEVKREVEGLRNEIKISQDIHSTVSPSFSFNSPPPDSTLPKMEENIKKVIKETLSGYGLSENVFINNEIPTDEKINYLFSVRYNIEKELRYLATPFLINNNQYNKYLPIYKIVEVLVKNEIINPMFGHSIREIYSVCSPAVHGEEINEDQLKFVKETAPEAINTLKAISKNIYNIKRPTILKE